MTVTQAILDFAESTGAGKLPAEIEAEANKALVNALGCILGGAHHVLTDRAVDALTPFFGSQEASLLGRGTETDILHAALLNASAGAAYSFDDNYSEGLLHPSVPMLAAMLALAQRHCLSGTAFLRAYAIGLEIACRLTSAMTVSPAEPEPAWSQTGVACGIAIAVAAGVSLGLSRQQLNSAIGIAASQASGTRAAHGSMTASLIFGQAAQTGLRATILAAAGFNATPDTLDSDFGPLRVFSRNANPQALTDKLGSRFELLSITYKSYPSGVVTHAAIDSALALRSRNIEALAEVSRLIVSVGSVSMKFGMRPAPKTDIEAKNSIQHWVAASMVYGRAGIAEGTTEAINDPRVLAIREKISILEDPARPADSAAVEMILNDGRSLQHITVNRSGSVARPMTDAELKQKFLGQANLSIGEDRARALLSRAMRIAEEPDSAVIARLAR